MSRVPVGVDEQSGRRLYSGMTRAILDEEWGAAAVFAAALALQADDTARHCDLSEAEADFTMCVCQMALAAAKAWEAKE